MLGPGPDVLHSRRASRLGKTPQGLAQNRRGSRREHRRKRASHPRARQAQGPRRAPARTEKQVLGVVPPRLNPVDDRQRRRTQIDWSTPSASRFATIELPPTLTNGSGIPVIGAIPIVIPTLMKIWMSNANAMPPAAIAANASRARVMTLIARQMTSR